MRLTDRLLLDLLKVSLARVDPALGLEQLDRIRSAAPTDAITRASEQVGRARRRLDWLPPRVTMALWLAARLVPERSAWRQQLRVAGRDIPWTAETMVGLVRLENVERLALDVLARGIPGDFVEAGAWRGGVGVLMRTVQLVADAADRRVWLADSFEGLPAPDAAVTADRGSPYHLVRSLSVGRHEVERNIERYLGQEDGIVLVEGWFADTLPPAGLPAISLLRVDADMYSSTMDALSGLYHLVSPGGYVVIDDYGAIAACRAAVDDFRARNDVHAPLTPVDFTGVYWRV